MVRVHCTRAHRVAAHERAACIPGYLRNSAFWSGFAASRRIFPHIVRPTLSIWDAAAPRSSQIFLLVGVLIIVRIILAYIALAYWVFRGKVRHGDEGYY